MPSAVCGIEIKSDADTYTRLNKQAKLNPKVNWKKKLSLLWRPVLAYIQELNRIPQYRQKSKAFVVDKILAKVSREDLSCQISEELFEKDYNEIEEVIKVYRSRADTHSV